MGPGYLGPGPREHNLYCTLITCEHYVRNVAGAGEADPCCSNLHGLWTQFAGLEVWFYPFARCLMLGDLFIFSELPFSYLWSTDFFAEDCLQ